MENKSQVYLLSFIMYLIVGLAGYINQITNYWIVLLLSFLVCAYTLGLVFLNNKELKETTKVEWISVSSFFVLEMILTVYSAVVKVPYVGFFKYFNYGVQILGLIFAIYSIVRYVLLHTSYVELIKEKIASKKASKEIKQDVMLDEVKNEIASEVQEVIAEEEEKEDNTDVEVVETENIEEEKIEEEVENEVIGIEYKQEKEIPTPYMEEEI